MAPVLSATPPRAVSSRMGLALAFAVFATRLPFVWEGFGTDTDTWKFAASLREMAATGRYTASRMPGYPLMELLCTPLWKFGPWAPNALSGVAAAACAWLGARLFARSGVRDAWLAGAAFVFVPAAYIAGTSSMDYLWAIAFVLAAWLQAVEGRAARAGLLLGLAVGTRLTSAVLLAPLAWLVWSGPVMGRTGRLARFVLSAGVVGALWYVPVFRRYGWEMFTYSEIRGGQSSALHFVGGMLHPGDAGVPWPLIAGQATVLLWGLVGCAALTFALLGRFAERGPAERAARIAPAEAQAAVGVVALEALLYLRLPHDEGYLLPIVPFVLLGLAAMVTPGRLRAVCMALLLSPFLFGVDVQPPKKGLTPAAPSNAALTLPVGRETVLVEPLRGPVLRDFAKRRRMAELARWLEDWWPGRPERFRLVTGNMQAMTYYYFPEAGRQGLISRSYSNQELAEARASGTPVFALPDVIERHRIMDAGFTGADWIPVGRGTVRR